MHYSPCYQILEVVMSSNSSSLRVLLYIARIVCASICKAGIHVASMSILYSDLAMHLLLSVKHGMVPHLVHVAGNTFDGHPGINHILITQWSYLQIGIYGCLVTIVVGIVDRQYIIIQN